MFNVSMNYFVIQIGFINRVILVYSKDALFVLCTAWCAMNNFAIARLMTVEYITFIRKN